jgi:fructokinase
MSAARTARARLPAAPTLDVICFGEALWDLFERARPAAGEPIAREFRRELGGAPANVATGLARLGFRAAVAGGIGFDKFGDALERDLAKDGVSTHFLIRLPNRTGARWVLVGTSTMMTPSLAAATDRFLTVAEGAKANVVVDLNVHEHLWPSKAQMRDAVAQLVRRASIVKGSFADLVAITGRRDILWLADHAPRAAWIVTQGAKGASALGDHGFVARAARKARCVDATGAGDAFVAGVLAVLLEAAATPGTSAWRDERVWSAALEAGHAMGAKAVSRVGAVTGLVDLKEVAELVKSVRRLPPSPSAHTRRGKPSAAKRRGGRSGRDR